MTKAHYRYNRYLFLLPKSIGGALDTSTDYEVRLINKFIVMVPKGLEDARILLANLESESNRVGQKGRLQSTEDTDLENAQILKDSRRKYAFLCGRQHSIAGFALSEEYTVCRCGAKFTNNAEGKRLYDLHQSWCGKQGSTHRESEGHSRGKI